MDANARKGLFCMSIIIIQILSPAALAGTIKGIEPMKNNTDKKPVEISCSKFNLTISHSTVALIVYMVMEIIDKCQ